MLSKIRVRVALRLNVSAHITTHVIFYITWKTIYSLQQISGDRFHLLSHHTQPPNHTLDVVDVDAVFFLVSFPPFIRFRHLSVKLQINQLFNIKNGLSSCKRILKMFCTLNFVSRNAFIFLFLFISILMPVQRTLLLLVIRQNQPCTHTHTFKLNWKVGFEWIDISACRR